jgi:hypothetical protein
MMIKFEKGIFDEHGCFSLGDFQKGDNIVVMERDPLNRDNRVRVKGIVISTVNRPPSVTLSDINGRVITARLNDVAFLQAPQRGWLER